MRNDGAAYSKALAKFGAHCKRENIVLLTPADVDLAASSYMSSIGKGEAIWVICWKINSVSAGSNMSNGPIKIKQRLKRVPIIATAKAF